MVSCSNNYFCGSVLALVSVTSINPWENHTPKASYWSGRAQVLIRPPSQCDLPDVGLVTVSLVHLFLFSLTLSVSYFKLAWDSCIATNASDELPSNLEKKAMAVIGLEWWWWIGWLLLWRMTSLLRSLPPPPPPYQL